MTTTSDQLHEIIAAYNEAWNAHDVDRIGSMHAPDMVFENHTAGERAEGEAALDHIARIFESWPDIAFETRRLYVHEDLVVQEWTARATHERPLSRGDILAEPSSARMSGRGSTSSPSRTGESSARTSTPTPWRSCARSVALRRDRSAARSSELGIGWQQGGNFGRIRWGSVWLARKAESDVLERNRRLGRTPPKR